MWLWLLIPFALELEKPTAVHADEGAPTELGSAPADEARILWMDAQAAMKDERYSDALPKLKRIVDRHPGVPYYLEAHRLLGEAYLLMGQAKESLAPIRYFVDGSRKMPETAEARLLLGRALAALKRWDELLLLSTESEKMTRSAGPNAKFLLAEALRLKATALQGLNRDDQAERALDSAAAPDGKPLGPDSPARLRAEIALNRLELKVKACARLPSAKRLSEDQTRDQFTRRSQCALESLARHEEVAHARDPRTLKNADEVAHAAFHSLFEAAESPPAPPPLKPVERTGRQLKEYHDELARALLAEARATLRQALELLKGKPSQASLRESLKGLQTASERNSP